MSPKSHDTVVFIPAWNEEDNLPAVLEELRQGLPDADVVVIDDGSTDGTAQVARDGGAEVVSFGENRGLRAGIAAGYGYANDHGYAFCGRVDADGQHPATELRAPAGDGAGGDVRRGDRLALRDRRGPRRRPLRAEPRAPLRHRRPAPLDEGRARPPVPRRDQRDVRRQREGAAVPRPAVHERGTRGAGDPAARQGGYARRGGARAHARARERRVEAAGQEGARWSC